MSALVNLEANTLEFGAAPVCWAGPDPRGLGGICFGTEGGELVFPDPTRGEEAVWPKASKAGEAINGVATHHNLVAVTTRADVCFLDTSRPGAIGHTAFDGGAHGVIALPDGSFVAALGRRGLLVVAKRADGRTAAHVAASRLDLNYYSLTSLGEKCSTPAVAYAARKGGFGFYQVTAKRSGQFFGGLGLDAVDVCSLSPKSMALCAVGIDGKVALVRDVLTAAQPQSYELPRPLMRGVVYRAVCCRGHLVILTSRDLWVITNVAHDFIVNGSLLEEHVTHRIPLANGVDMQQFSPDQIAVLAETECLLIDMRQFESVASGPNVVGNQLAEVATTGQWGDSALEQSTELLAT